MEGNDSSQVLSSHNVQWVEILVRTLGISTMEWSIASILKQKSIFHKNNVKKAKSKAKFIDTFKKV